MSFVTSSRPLGLLYKIEGRFRIEPRLKIEQIRYLRKFSARSKRGYHPEECSRYEDPIRIRAGIPEVGSGGQYYTGDNECFFGMVESPFPSSRCTWNVSGCGNYIVSNEAMARHPAAEWMQYIVQHFMVRWDRTVNGSALVEEIHPSRKGRVIVENNVTYWNEHLEPHNVVLSY